MTNKIIWNFNSQDLGRILLEQRWTCKVEVIHDGEHEGILIRIPLLSSLAEDIVSQNGKLFNATIKEKTDTC